LAFEYKLKAGYFLHKLVAYLLLSIIWILPCRGADNWQACKLKAQSADVRRQYGDAIKFYEQALSLLTADHENERVFLEASIILDLRQTGKIDRSVSHFNSLLKAAKFLKESKSLNSESLFSMQSLIESADIGPDLKQTNDEKHHFAIIAMAESMELAQIAFPEMLTLDRYRRVSRSYISVGDLSLAEIWLKRTLLSRAPNAAERAELELQLATAQNKLSRPQALKKLTAQLFDKKSKAVALRTLAEANIWIADYDKATSQLDQALLAVTKQSDPADKFLIYDSYIARYLDVSDLKNAEKYLRLQIDALEPLLKKHQSYRAMHLVSSRRLIAILKQERKDAEAQAISSRLHAGHEKTKSFEKYSKETDFFLSDKDREALRKAQRQ